MFITWIYVFYSVLIPDLYLHQNEMNPEMEFKEFEPRFKSAKTRFK